MRKLETWFPLLVLSAGLFILFWEVFLHGYVQVPADIRYRYDPVYLAQAPVGFQGAKNELASDHIYLNHPLQAAVERNWKQGEGLALWNPYIFTGSPMLADTLAMPFYPPNWALFFLDAAVAATLRTLFNILVAGLCAYLYARTIGISRSGALLVCISFAFCSIIMAGPGYQFIGVLVWLPLLLWAGENMLGAGSANGTQAERAAGLRRGVANACVAAASIGVGLWSGHAESTFHVLALAGIYFLSRLTWVEAPASSRVRSAVLLALAALAGIALGAVSWLPLADFLRLSGTSTRAHFGGSIVYYTGWSEYLAGLATALIPNFFGNPQGATYFWPFHVFTNYLEQAIYFGLIPLALAVGAAVGLGRKRRLILLLAGLAVGSLLVAYRFPLVEAIHHLPIFSMVNNNRLRWFFPFFGAVLAGFGLDGLRAYLLSGRRENRAVFYAAGITIAFGALLLAAGVAARGLALRGYIQVSPDVQRWLYNVFTYRQPRTAVSALVIVLGLGLWTVMRFLPAGRVHWGWPALQAGLLALTFFELVGIGRGYNTTVPHSMVVPELELVDRLHQDAELYRILPVSPAFSPNLGMVYGLQDVSGFTLPVLKSFTELYGAHPGKKKTYNQAWPADTPLADFLNVKYIITAAALEPLPAGYREIEVGAGYVLYQNEEALPRACLVGQVDVIPDSERRIGTLMSGTYDFSQRVILAQPLPANQAAALEAVQTPVVCDAGQVEVAAYHNDRVALRTHSQEPALLVLSDAYTPDWRASVDGEPAAIVPANHAYRAVFVPGGEHRVEFRYRPWAFYVGAGLTLAALTLICAGLVWGTRRRV